MNTEVIRCPWCGTDPLYVKYHDEEWGKAVHDDKLHFEFLILESFQAGLSWITILRKRENFRKAFCNFDAEKVSQFTAKDILRLKSDEGIVRNELKIKAAIENAKSFLKIQEEYGSYDSYIWKFTNHKPIINKFESLKEIPTSTKEAIEMSKALKAKGMKFVGPTICYANMQATGMVNDHLISCFRHRACS